jgi:3-phenylpropionate/cinnamic acid dioxygenase small subunit
MKSLIHMEKISIDLVHQLLFLEARLLDLNRFEEWLNLYSEDCIYWVPLELNQVDGINTSSIIYDDKTLMEIRIRQYSHARAHARSPLPRTVHSISNIQIENGKDGSFDVFSNLIVGEYRKNQQKTWFATVNHQLISGPDGLKISHKRVNLINSEAELDGITILF